MALASNTFLNAALGDGTDKGGLSLVTDASLHTASPSTTGANECSGSGYARQPCTFGNASGAAASNTGALVWTFTGSISFSYVGTYTALTSGTYLIGAQLTSSQSFGSGGGTFTIAIGGLSISAS